MSVKFNLIEETHLIRLRTKDLSDSQTQSGDISLPVNYSLYRDILHRIELTTRSLNQKNNIIRECKLDAFDSWSPAKSNRGKNTNVKEHYSDFSYPKPSCTFGKAKRNLESSPSGSPGPASYSPTLSGASKAPAAALSKRRFSNQGKERSEFLRLAKDSPGPQYFPSRHFVSGR